MSNLNPGGLTRVLNYIKTWVTGLLNDKANSSHSHTKSQITDFPTIPSKTSQLTNDSGFLTAHQSLSNYSTLANTVKSLSISGKTITVTPGSGNAYTLTTQDTVYTHPTSAGNKHIPSGGSSGQFLGWDSAGTAKWVNNPNSDTKNTAGSTDTSSKIFLVGATSQAANPQTYSHDTAYVGTDGCLYSGGTKVLTAHQSLSNYLDKSTEQTISAFKIGKGNSTAGFAAQSADGKYRATLMVGSGGCNRGIWDDYLQMWIVYANDTACYLNGTATKATYNANGKELVNSIIKGLSVSGRTITYTKLDGSTGTITTQDTNTTYSNFVKSGSGAAAGLVPAPSTTAGTTKYLREDGTWQVPPDHTYTVNNATLTIQKNGTTVNSFTANASSNVTCNITVPTNTNQLTNGAGFITSSGSCASCTEAAYMGQHSTITYGVNRLQYYNTSTSTTSGATSNANPTNDWYYHLLMSHANNNGYYGDIALCFHSNTLAFRRIASGGDNGWCYIVKNGRTIVSGYEVYVG